MDADLVARATQLQEKVRQAEAARAGAEGVRAQNEAQLAQILATNSVQTIDELRAVTAQAQQEAARLLAAAEAALGPA